MLTIEHQIEDMAARLPDWEMTRVDSRTARWVGELKPYNTSYKVQIEHTVPPVFYYWSLLYVQPLVEVLSPLLKRKSKNPEGPLPHVYWKHPRTKRNGPFLCLFDAEAREWSLSDTLVETTVPFSLNWLQSYEGWLVTDRWLGLGRHVELERSDDEPDNEKPTKVGTGSGGNSINRYSSLLTTTTTLGR